MSPNVSRRTSLRLAAACAAALAAAAPQAARAVIFQSTGSTTFNTTAPTGTYANSGWQYQFNIGSFLGTPVGPNHFVTAAHVGGTGQFFHDGELFTSTLVQDYGDLRLLSVDKTFHSYAPLYEAGDGSEVGKEMVVFGRGTQRGSAVSVGGVQKGWNWGAIDGVRRWGTNVVADVPAVYGGTVLRFDFDLGAGLNEAVLSDHDSGGGVFIKVNGQWKLAAVNFAVTGPHSELPSGPEFLAALYDTTGLFNHEFNIAGVGPSGAYASRVSPNATSIKNFLNLPPTWRNRNGGSWSTASNWSNLTGNVVPNAVGATADFRTAIDAPQNVTFSGTVTVGTINLDNPGASYSLIPSISSSQLRLNVSSGIARVNVASGSHSIGGLVLDDPTTFHIIAPTALLTLNGFNANGQAITKSGAGTLRGRGLMAGQVTVSQGTLMMGPGTSNGTSKMTGVSIATAAGAKLDLAATNLVVSNTPVGAKSGANYTGLQGLIQQAYAGGAWSGAGITSSTAATTNGLTTLAIARAGDVLSFGGASTRTWSGQTVTANDALIAYTYRGDANLDGFISADDYTVIDFAFATPGSSGYANGDFNYDGFISADDYTAIDFNLVAQGSPLLSSAAEFGAEAVGVSAVPEPASLSILAVASALFMSRRRDAKR